MNPRRIRRRLRLAATTALGVGLTAFGALAGTAGATAPPPATNPQVAAIQGAWGEGGLVSAQDRPDCLGLYTPSSPPAGVETFRESKETWNVLFGSSDPRFSPANAVFYLHMLRDVSAGTLSYGDNGAVDGTYALFDANGLAMAQGVIQGATRANGQYFDSTENFDGLLYGGQVLRPSGATIGQPHLVGNFESTFDQYNADANHDEWSGEFGGNNTGGTRPAVVVGGSCPGSYKVRPTTQVNSSTRSARTAGPAPALLTREAAYVQSLYDRGGH